MGGDPTVFAPTLPGSANTSIEPYERSVVVDRERGFTPCLDRIRRQLLPVDRRLRVQGVVDRGTVESTGGDTAFDISFNDATISVVYDGEPGGIFKECIPVVVHGVIENGTLLGDRVEVKHSDEYVAVNDERVADAEAAGCPDASTT